MRGETGCPNIVLIGLPSLKSLQKAAHNIPKNIPRYEWHEPDWNEEFTALVTAPVRGADREYFKKYRVYAPVAQHPECLTLNQADLGENPSGSTILPGSAEASARV